MSTVWPRTMPTRALLARGLAQIPGITVEEPETNLVFFDTEAPGLTAADLFARVRRRACFSVSGLALARLHPPGRDRAGVEAALEVIRREVPPDRQCVADFETG